MINSDMWEQRFTTVHGGFSVRSIITYALAALVATFLWIIAAPQTTLAAPDVNWDGAAINYQGHSYAGPADAPTVQALALPAGTTVYSYVEPETATNRKIHILYFAPGVDPGTAERINYRTHPYNGPSNFGDPSGAVALTIDPKNDNIGTSSCVIDNGLGFVICPLTNMLANFMDFMFNTLTSFLTVRPIDTGQESALFRAWSYMRTFANIAFVIAFLIILYSQLTSFGVSNYGIKKLLPRVIIAAILVNISFIICAAAIDISNILGHSVQNVFLMMRNSLVGTEGNSWDLISWESISSYILSGGATAATGSLAAFLTITEYGIAGSVALLLPALAALLIAILVALLVMAGRQALITVLTILAPLAFVAYLLPNTEKLFDKWRNTFITMLILFPAFSVIFGGSQLAGILIIQNANSINLVILGMIVQVAPLFITPLLIKFSGSLLGRIAGIVNDPNRGLIDRTRNFSKELAEDIRAKRMANPARPGILGVAQRAGQRVDNYRRRRKGWRNAWNAQADANWANSDDFSDIDQVARRAAERKQVGETKSAVRYNRAKTTNVELRELDIEVRKVKLDLDNAEVNAELKNWNQNRGSSVVAAKIQQRALKSAQAAIQDQDDADYEEFRSGRLPKSIPPSPEVLRYAALARDSLVANRLANEQKNSALEQQTIDYAQYIKNNEAAARKAGGIRGEEGYLSIMAKAAKAASKYTLDDIANIKDTMSYDLATDPGRLLEAFRTATTMTQRVAYAHKLSQNGAPGIKLLRTAFDEYSVANANNIGDLMTFKELTATQSGIAAAGKDIEFWLNNAKDATGALRGFADIRDDPKTWTNMGALPFASMNADSHRVALERLRDADAINGTNNYMNTIDMLRNNPNAMAQIKQQVRETFSIYSDDEINNRPAGQPPLPAPGTYRP